MIFCDVFNPDGPYVIIKRKIKAAKDVGPFIKQDWIDKSTLLHDTLELHSFIAKGNIV